MSVLVVSARRSTSSCNASARSGNSLSVSTHTKRRYESLRDFRYRTKTRNRRSLIGDLDHDLAKVIARFEMAVGVLGMGEVEDAIDRRFEFVGGDRPIHLFEHGSAADIDSLDGDAAPSDSGTTGQRSLRA